MPDPEPGHTQGPQNARDSETVNQLHATLRQVLRQ